MGWRQQPRQRFEYRCKVLRGVRSFTYTYSNFNIYCYTFGNTECYSHCYRYAYDDAQCYANTHSYAYSQANPNSASQHNAEDTAHSAAAPVEINCRLVPL
jgi:hypothetical protein